MPLTEAQRHEVREIVNNQLGQSHAVTAAINAAVGLYTVTRVNEEVKTAVPSACHSWVSYYLPQHTAGTLVQQMPAQIANFLNNDTQFTQLKNQHLERVRQTYLEETNKFIEHSLSDNPTYNQILKVQEDVIHSRVMEKVPGLINQRLSEQQSEIGLLKVWCGLTTCATFGLGYFTYQHHFRH